jgi:hypothetical protein
MINSIIIELEDEFIKLKNKVNDYTNENSFMDGHTKWLVGQMVGIKTALEIIRKEQ